MKPGDDLWKYNHAGTFMRVQMGEEPTRHLNPERLVKLEAERLQESLDRAAIAFADSTRPPSPPFPDHLLSPVAPPPQPLPRRPRR